MAEATNLMKEKREYMSEQRTIPYVMRFRLACGHYRKIHRWTSFHRLAHEPCQRCLQEKRGK